MDRVVARTFHTVDYGLQSVQLTFIRSFPFLKEGESNFSLIVYFISFISRSVYLQTRMNGDIVLTEGSGGDEKREEACESVVCLDDIRKRQVRRVLGPKYS